MSEAIITVEGLGKRYSLRHQTGERYTALRDVVAEAAVKPFRSLRRKFTSKNGSDSSSTRDLNSSRQTREDFWALKDINFKVKQGEVLGIIGRNGAGKSTLLKILSRITDPTEGRIRIKGRVASLLEVGTGFHPELTGRENIFLNGAILGMARSEIKAKFDAIVAFAEVEKFLDTPVKRYSSGMYVRLAFAVAAHLEPEILIVDEVLAVGDAVFQDKCLCKMRDVAEGGGRTVLFVSHNMNAIQSLCQRCLVIQHGRIDFVGIVSAAVDHYLKKPELILRDQIVEGCKRSGTGEARVISVRLETDDGSPQTHFRMGEPLNIFVTAEFPSEIRDPTFGVNIVTDSGIMVADCRSSHYGLKTGPVVGLLEYRMRIEQILLYPRAYALEPWVADSGCLSDFDWVRDAARFVVTSDAEFRAGPNVTSRHGISYIPTTWAATRVSKEAAAVDV